MLVNIETENGVKKVKATSLDVARLVASAYGWYDVDIEPMGPNRVTVTAYGDNRSINFNGVSVQDACEKLINMLTEV